MPECVHCHPPNLQTHAQAHHVQQLYNVDCQRCGKICCFADDSSYSFSNVSAPHISATLGTKYNIISDYMASHELKLNSAKTHMLLIQSDAAKRANPTFTVELNTGSEMIQPSKSEKLLGGIISQNLKFSDHIQNDENSMLKILNLRLNALRKISFNASFKTRKAVANGIILSRIIYLIPLWAGCEKYLINALQIIQNKAARVVTRKGRMTSISRLLKECGWLSISQLGVYHSLVLVYKILQSRSPQYLYDKLTGTQGEPHYQTRYTRKLATGQLIKLGPDSVAESELARNSFKYRATRQWNDLPPELKQVKILSKFKSELRRWIRENVPIR